MRGKVGLVIAGVVGLAVGVLGGLLVAAVSSESLAEVTAERDKLAQEVHTLQQEEAGRVAELTARVDTLQEQAAAKAVDLKEEAKRNREIAEKALAEQLKMLSLLQMCIDNDAVLKMQRTDRFRSRFKQDWYWPALAYKTIGGRWFAEEMLASGVIDQKQFDLIMAAGESSPKAPPKKKPFTEPPW